MIGIEKGVPIPEKKDGRRKPFKYPWHQMGAGDSFFVATPCDHSAVQKTLIASAYRLKIKVTTRQVTEDGVKGVRAWRVA